MAEITSDKWSAKKPGKLAASTAVDISAANRGFQRLALTFAGAKAAQSGSPARSPTLGALAEAVTRISGGNYAQASLKFCADQNSGYQKRSQLKAQSQGVIALVRALRFYNLLAAEGHANSTAMDALVASMELLAQAAMTVTDAFARENQTGTRPAVGTAAHKRRGRDPKVTLLKELRHNAAISGAAARDAQERLRCVGNCPCTCLICQVIVMLTRTFA